MRKALLVIAVIAAFLFVTQAACAPKIKIATQTASNAEALSATPAAPLNPSEISSNVLWLRADQSAGWVETSRTTQVSNGTFIRAWDDQSGNARHFNTQSGGLPRWRTTGPNGTPFVDFDSADWLTLESGLSATFNAEHTQARSALIVGRVHHALPTGLTNFFNKRDSSGTGWNPLRVTGGGLVFSILNQPAVQIFRVSTTDTDLITPSVWFWGLTAYNGTKNNGLSVDFYVNSDIERANTALNTNLNSTILNSSVAKVSRRRDGLNNDTVYYISELALWDKQITAQEVSSLATYINNRYGL